MLVVRLNFWIVNLFLEKFITATNFSTEVLSLIYRPIKFVSDWKIKPFSAFPVSMDS